MNSFAVKTLKASICPKDKWVPDKDASNCSGCNSKFSKVFAWKHHCRICGRIFCSACCSLFIPVDPGDFDEKNLRSCEPCYRRIDMLMNKKGYDER